MTDCEKHQILISSYIDGELTVLQETELNEHLDSCESCRALLEIYESISDTSDDNLESPPAELLSGVMTGIEKTRSGRKRVQTRRFIGAFVAIAACIALVVYAAPNLSNIFMSSNKAESDMAVPNEAMPPAMDSGYDGYESESATSSNSGGAAADTITEGEAATEAPQAAPPSDGEYEKGNEDLVESADRTRDVYVVINIKGELPELLSGFEMTDTGSNVYEIYVPSNIADKLMEEGYEGEINNEGADTALIIYSPEE